jgi:acyl-CoA hydrolase
MRSLLLAASVVFAALAFSRNAEAILFSGNTATSSPTTIDTFLTYTSANFLNVDVPIGPGPTSLSNLGTFTLNVCSGNNCVENFVTDFTLRITFTDPVVSGSPALFTADISGTISRSGNSNNIGNGSLLTIDFVNTAQHFNYSSALGSGEFDISVNDPAPYTEASQFGNTRTVTGQITNLTFTETLAAVPEPASMILFGIGLLGLGFVTKRG